MQDPLHEIAQALADAAQTAAAGGFAARAAAAESLEVHALDRLEILAARGAGAGSLDPLRARAGALLARWDAANTRVLGRLRARIRAARYTRPGLRRALLRHGGPAGPSGAYDGLDLLVQGLLAHGVPAEPRAALGPDMVPYQPTPARAILELLERARIGPDDLLVDLGSGLGQVALLTALLSGARARGVELEPAYVDYARRCAGGLAVPGVEFVHADARAAPLRGGTVFYLFTPFKGLLLREVLERLRAEEGGRPLKICAYGPCVEWVSKQAWLRPAESGAGRGSGVAVFQNL
ncbi:MAG TPA: methyltransferase domain-containing protein [bacterium]|nr:methyltransferase domain-containing protein [bacterium]